MDQVKERFAMVLAGGGAKGMYQVGVFEAMLEYPIEITAISGTSIGGINAFAYASLPLERIQKLWENIQSEELFDMKDLWFDGLCDRKKLESMIEDILPDGFFESDIRVYNTICQDASFPEYRILNGQSAENVKKLLLATSALPIIYPEVNIDGKNYVDGGLADNFPVYPIFRDGYKNVITVGLSAGHKVDRVKYPFEHVIEIVPSEDLGDLIDGTLNFSKEYKHYARRLGYYDAKRVFNSYFGRDNLFHTQAYDSRQIAHEMKVSKLEEEINDRLKKLSKYLD